MVGHPPANKAWKPRFFFLSELDEEGIDLPWPVPCQWQAKKDLRRPPEPESEEKLATLEVLEALIRAGKPLDCNSWITERMIRKHAVFTAAEEAVEFSRLKERAQEAQKREAQLQTPALQKQPARSAIKRKSGNPIAAEPISWVPSKEQVLESVLKKVPQKRQRLVKKGRSSPEDQAIIVHSTSPEGESSEESRTEFIETGPVIDERDEESGSAIRALEKSSDKAKGFCLPHYSALSRRGLLI